MDYCPGGEVFTYLRRAQRFDVPTARFYAAEILLILEFLHETQHVAYRDLKPENLLIDAQGHIKLVDFGFAKNVANGAYPFHLSNIVWWGNYFRSANGVILVVSVGASYSLCGTPEYLAPETIQSKGPFLSFRICFDSFGWMLTCGRQ